MIIGVAAVASIVVVPALWLAWRDHRLTQFCEQIRPGITLVELLSLEKRFGIDESFLVQSWFDEYVDQAHEKSLDFRSYPLDPEIQCSVGHNGVAVTSAILLRLDPALVPDSSKEGPVRVDAGSCASSRRRLTAGCNGP